MGEFKLLLENLEAVINKTYDGKGSAIKAVAINLKNVHSVDASALLTFHEMVEAYHHKGIKTCFIEVNDKVRARFEISGIVKATGAEYFFNDNASAIEHIETNITQLKRKTPPPTEEFETEAL